MSKVYFLYHHGIKGQRWGVRRYQNADGTLTPAGKQRYLNSDGTLTRKGLKEYWKGKTGRKNQITNRDINLASEFQVGAGKKKHAEFVKELNKYFNGDDDSEEAATRFRKAEIDYLSAEGKYVAEKLVKEFGKDDFTRYVNYGSGAYSSTYRKHQDVGKAFVENYVNVHSE